MQILSNGYKLPETGDFGDVWFPALEDNITRVNSHTHDGNNSEKLSSSSIEAQSSSVLSGAFVAQGGGIFRATVSVPAGMDYDKLSIVVKDPTTKEHIYLKSEKLSVSQFYLYTNFVQDVEVYFLT